MGDIWRVFRAMGAARGLALGGLLGLSVLAMGAALLGLSGWFITAASAAGMAGIGIAFDFFRPSAAVRALAMGRTASRYGERLVTHDATLKALVALRLKLFQGLLRAPFERLERLRGAQALNRLMADVDALDGVPLRLILPVATGLAVLAGSFFVLWGLTDLWLAAWISGGWLVLGLVSGALGIRASLGESRRAEAARQATSERIIGLLRARADLAVTGALGDRRLRAIAADARRQSARDRLERRGRALGAALSGGGTLLLTGTLILSALRVDAGTLDAPRAALALLVTLALAEALTPLRRLVTDLGRMRIAARRVVGALPEAEAPAGPAPEPRPDAPLLEARALGVARAGRVLVRDFDLSLHPGEVVALSGPSGAGKTTVLAALARLTRPAGGTLHLMGHTYDAWPKDAFRDRLGYVAQRPGLIAGTLHAALALGQPDLDVARAQAALEAVGLWERLEGRGLEAELGEGGAGLSGGEARRFAIARAIVRNPDVLILDEPTEGLDAVSAARLRDGLRRMLPRAGLIIASHQAADLDWADRVLDLA
ncbi:amino acid ABC transporter ATP-binding/permease protein [Phaeovulum vinaykumarii]|uniref:ATP-binding cassette, subfamily C, CydC n=1 Tax=Phaeovulum vinaykumarii TaxID=407234 RepID=A0A1N7K2J0_9RHOB|nr:ATP-binding cassette domain-containing protein [Phaeovulum vinaykumarii]SIS55758.1 ATP-binding cassette, subfamily C, CydC [Phaeovulum vinaykumarii]SOB92537.1 ATP-binding cassette subfamily C protein CydC [Phaeovulum vinaykumarii]